MMPQFGREPRYGGVGRGTKLKPGRRAGSDLTPCLLSQLILQGGGQKVALGERGTSASGFKFGLSSRGGLLARGSHTPSLGRVRGESHRQSRVGGYGIGESFFEVESWNEPCGRGPSIGALRMKELFLSA